MKPTIICHMMASLDGRIDCPVMGEIGAKGYDESLAALNLDTTFEGRVTVLADFALPDPFVSKDNTPVGKEEWYKSHEAPHWNVAVDTRGTLQYPETDVPGRLCLVSELATREYLDYLKNRGISYIVTGKDSIDILRAIDILTEHFGTKRIGVVGGGRLNGTFLKMGLLDGVSMVYGPAIDGREGMTAAFDGIKKDDAHPYMLKLRDVKRMSDDSIWIQYTTK